MNTPAVNFNFLSATLDSRISFARSGATATQVNSSGYIESVAADTARFDYDPVTLACKGLLLEQSSINYVTSSEVLNIWSAINTTSSANVAVSPSNAQTADKIIPNSSLAQHRIEFSLSVTNGVAYTFSIFGKSAGYNGIQLRAANDRADANFNLDSGTVASVSVGTARVENYGNGWFRCIVTGTANSTTSSVLRINVLNNNANSFSGNGTDGVFLWGAQLEVSPFATSYIPTSGGTATRNADVATLTGANFSSFWQASKGGVLVRARPGTVSGTRPWVQFDDNTADNIIALRGVNADPFLYVRDGGVDQANIDAGTIAANTSYRLAGAWAADSCAASINSSIPVLDGSATIPAATQMRLGSDGTNYLNGHLEAVEYYRERPTNAGLQVLSSSAGRRSIIQPVFNRII